METRSFAASEVLLSASPPFVLCKMANAASVRQTIFMAEKYYQQGFKFELLLQAIVISWLVFCKTYSNKYLKLSDVLVSVKGNVNSWTRHCMSCIHAPVKQFVMFRIRAQSILYDEGYDVTFKLVM